MMHIPRFTVDRSGSAVAPREEVAAPRWYGRGETQNSPYDKLASPIRSLTHLAVDL